VTILLLFIFNTYNKQILNNIKAEHQAYAKGIGREIRLHFDRTLEKTTTIAMTMNTLKLDDIENKILINIIIADAPYYSTIRFANIDGVVITGSEPMDEINDLSSFDGLDTILRGNIYRSNIMFDKSNIPHVTLGIPIKSLGEISGFLYTQINLKKLWQWFDDIDIPTLANLTIVEQTTNRIISDKRKINLGDPVTIINENSDPITLGSTQSLSFIIEDKLFSIYAINDFNLSVILESPTITFTSQIRNNLFYILSLAMIILFCAAIVGYIVAELSSRPVRNILDVLHKFPSQRKMRFNKNLVGEYDTIAKSFNQMADSIQKQEETLIQQENLATIGRTVSTIAHELRHGFHIILNLFYDLEQYESESLLQLKTILNDLNSKTNDLLEYSRAGKINITFIKVNDIAHKAIEPFPGRCVDVVKSVNNLVVGVDEAKIALAITNLIRNAIEAGDINIHITVSTKLSDNRIVFQVADDGPGIPEDIKNKIFDPFFTTKSGGFGIGLAFVSTVAKAHNGKILVENNMPSGAIFKIIIPHIQETEEFTT